ncbi:hypothetical protein J5X84_31560 [Streptosporangiaceae bacterium NEAU-GS5]|nr:hypothetical protein [Streptosporangiaceae bacterium NEAU-GS5]
MMAGGPELLRRTVAARWWGELIASDRRLQDTKIGYYKAFAKVASGGETRDRKVVVAAAGGAMSTFYKLFGPGGDRALLSAYAEHWGGERVATPDPTSRLGYETAVWAYWGHRQGWLSGLEQTWPHPSAVVNSLVGVVADFAAEWPHLVRATGWAPPICAIEDLCVATGGMLGWDGAAALLGQAARRGAADPKTPPEQVMDALRDDLAGLFPGRDAVAALAEGVDAVLASLGEVKSALLEAVTLAAADPPRPPVPVARPSRASAA